MRVDGLNLLSEAMGRDLARSTRIERERFCDRWSQKRIAESEQDQPQGRVADVMIFVAQRKLSNQSSDCFEDRVQSVSIA